MANERTLQMLKMGFVVAAAHLQTNEKKKRNRQNAPAIPKLNSFNPLMNSNKHWNVRPYTTNFKSISMLILRIRVGHFSNDSVSFFLSFILSLYFQAANFNCNTGNIYDTAIIRKTTSTNNRVLTIGQL